MALWTETHSDSGFSATLRMWSNLCSRWKTILTGSQHYSFGSVGPFLPFDTTRHCLVFTKCPEHMVLDKMIRLKGPWLVSGLESPGAKCTNAQMVQISQAVAPKPSCHRPRKLWSLPVWRWRRQKGHPPAIFLGTAERVGSLNCCLECTHIQKTLTWGRSFME